MFVPIIMGSRKDLEFGQQIADALAKFGIESDIRVASAHKATVYLLDLLGKYESEGRAEVYVTIAGRSNALSGVVDANVTAPVVACPPYSSKFGGADIYSSLRLPSGVAPAVVLEPGLAALLVAKMLTLSHPEMKAKVKAAQQAFTAQIMADDADLRNP